MRSESRKLIANTTMFFIGNIGSKLIQFLLVPLYTYTLSASEFGEADLIITTINFLVPFISIQITDGLLRFGLDKKEKQEDVIGCSFKILAIGSLISLLLVPVFGLSNLLRRWLIYFLIIMNLRMYRDLLAIVLKIKDKNKLFAVDSIIYTFVLCLLSVLFLAVFKCGVAGYFISYIIANIISIIFMMTASKTPISVFLKTTNKKLLKKLAAYSSPLVVNSLSYWITTAFDRYMINWSLGEESVGMYAVAAKIPMILSTIVSIFNQAWLLSSIDEYEKGNGTGFYSSIFKKYCQLSSIICALLILLINPFMKLYVSNEFYGAWIYSLPLIISAVFSGMCSFLNGIYYAYKKNISATTTTAIGAVVNIILNIVLIPKMGVMGATIATVMAWLVTMVCKLLYMRSFAKMNVAYAPLVISIVLLVIEMCTMYVGELVIKYAICVIIAGLVILINVQVIKRICELLVAKLLRKKSSR